MNKSELRRTLIERRQSLPDRPARAAALQQALLGWLAQQMQRNDAPRVIAAYWPIKGEFDPLPALTHWTQEATRTAPRRIGLPVVDAAHKTMQFHAWQPGDAMQLDAYGIAQPCARAPLRPDLLLVPCVGYGAGGYRLGYGGGFYDRAIAARGPRVRTLGLAFTCSFIENFEPEPHDVALDAILNENGLF